MDYSLTCDEEFMISLYKKIEKDINSAFDRIKEEFSNKTEILECVSYSLSLKGQLKRPLLLYLCYLSLNETLSDSISDIAISFEFMHTASLIHDDIIDNGMLRRGKESVFSKFGISSAILTGDFLIFYATKCICNQIEATYDRLKIIEKMNTIYCEMCIGQMRENILISNLNASIEEYLEVITLKTANFLSLISEVAAIMATNSSDNDDTISFKSFGHNIGIAYQIRDDLLNFIDDKQHQNKSVNSDNERKLVTLPILLAYKNGNTDQRLQLATYFESDKKIDHNSIKKILVDTNSISYSKVIIDDYISKAQLAISKVENSQAKNSLIKFSNALKV